MFCYSKFARGCRANLKVSLSCIPFEYLSAPLAGRYPAGRKIYIYVIFRFLSLRKEAGVQGAAPPQGKLTNIPILP